MSSVALVKDVVSRVETSVSAASWTAILPSSPGNREGIFLFNSGSSDVLYRLRGSGGAVPGGTPNQTGSSGVLVVGETRYLAIGAEVGLHVASAIGSGSVVVEEVI